MSKMRDLKGYRKGALIAVKPVGKDKHGHYLWEVLCQKCGKTKVMNSVQLLDDKPTKDCGCTPVSGYDLTGQDMGTFTVINPVGNDKKRSRLWLCRCRICGKKCVLPTPRLTGTSGKNIAACPACGAWADNITDPSELLIGGKHGED